MNNDPHNDLARYHGFPPLSPPHEPTPTIPQMEDRHKRDAFAGEAMAWLHRFTAVACGVFMAVFVVALIFRLTVGVY
jgi:hypothetical protein